MVPRTVQMAAEVAVQLTTTELDAYGNVILNGYATTGANLTGKLAWQYKETISAPAPLPSVTSVRPALKGWSTNYAEYYTQLQPNGYGVNPGDPTGFNYNVHSFTKATGPILTTGFLQPGAGYTPGVYIGVVAVGGSGTGATIDYTVDATGTVVFYAISAPGINYAVNDGLSVGSVPGAGFSVRVTGVTIVNPAGQPRWAQPSHRFYQNQVSSFVPPNVNQQAIPYSFMYPVADNSVAPPIDIL